MLIQEKKKYPCRELHKITKNEFLPIGYTCAHLKKADGLDCKTISFALQA